MSNIIKFYKGEETGIVHENYAGADISLFKDQYIKALREIGAYLSTNSSEINNVFAFIGDRGTGKTSCMESVAEMLESHQYDNSRESIISEDIKNILKNKSYCVLKTLDPSIFDDKSNILEIVVGKMFKDFDEIFKKLDIKGDEEDRKRTINIFKNITRCLKYMSSDSLLSGNGDNIAQLGDMSLVSDLQKHFKELVESYLKVFHKDILVIKIDDIDMQVKQAPKMVEQLRKYFIQKNVLVLMAVNIEQLQSVIELDNTEDFKPLMDINRMAAYGSSDMAAKYLLKFIPIGHRIYMPTFEAYADSVLEYYDSDKQIGYWSSAKYAITILIFRKTRFLFYHTKGEVSPIVPRNLREFRHLLAMLYNMNNYDKHKPDFSNKSQFLDYFNGIWVGNNIAAKDYDIVENIRNIKDASRINKVVVQQLINKFGSTLLTSFEEGYEQIPEILNVKNVQYNISIADVMVVLEYIKQRTVSISDKMLLFYIESFYSIRLYQYYDVLTEPYQNWWKELRDEYDFDKAVDSTIRKRNIVDKYSDYEVLTGGRFINTDYYTLVPAESNTQIDSESKSKKTSNPRDHRKILFDVLKTMATELTNGSPRLAGLPQEEVVRQLQLVEFFALCTSRVLDSREKINNQYRLYDNLSYQYGFQNQNKYVLFDLGSFIFNIVDIKRAYNRIHPQLFNEAEITKGSLYNQLLEICGEERGWENQPYAILSCACIRNYEILTDFVKNVMHSWEKRSPSKKNTENLIMFFNRVAGYKINIYDKREGKLGKERLKSNVKERTSVSTEFEEIVEDEVMKQAEVIPYKISFAYAKVISDVLKNIGEELFNTVFVESNDGHTNKQSRRDMILFTFDVEALMSLFSNADEYGLNTFRRNVLRYCKPVFEQEPSLKSKWNKLQIFKGKLENRKISQDDMRRVLITFKNDNNLL